MDIVIQCAANKDPNAGCLQTIDGQRVQFVAQPRLGPKRTGVIYAQPDDPSDTPGFSWRERLEKYVVENGQDNPLELARAYELYRPSAYGKLVKRFGSKNVFILSAGWGLIRADYLTPAYDVTFSRAAKKKKPMAYLTSGKSYQYFQQIPQKRSGPIVFIGGRDYVALFESLTATLNRERIVFTRASDSSTASRSKVPAGIEERPFAVLASTNWHYQCAQALVSGKLKI